jgi:hypothetical protein
VLLLTNRNRTRKIGKRVVKTAIPGGSKVR